MALFQELGGQFDRLRSATFADNAFPVMAVAKSCNPGALGYAAGRHPGQVSPH